MEVRWERVTVCFPCGNVYFDLQLEKEQRQWSVFVRLFLSSQQMFNALVNGKDRIIFFDVNFVSQSERKWVFFDLNYFFSLLLFFYFWCRHKGRWLKELNFLRTAPIIIINRIRARARQIRVFVGFWGWKMEY